MQRTVDGVTLNDAYDLANRVVAEFNSTGGWNRGEVYAGSRHLATYADSTTYFDFGDSLGTERAVMTLGNSLQRTCSSDAWGSTLNCSGSALGSPNPIFLTGKPRDPETGLDNFGARYNASSLGRWMTPDWSAQAEPVPYAKLDNPQSLDLYTYVLNNPTSSVDPDGHWPPWLDHLEQEHPRTTQFTKGLGQASVGLAGVIAAGVTAAGSAGIGIPAAIVVAQGAAVSVAIGVNNMMGAAIPKNENSQPNNVVKANEALSATRNVAGQVATIVTQGDLRSGEAAATVADVATTNPADFAHGTAAQRAANAVLGAATAQAVKSQIHHAPPRGNCDGPALGGEKDCSK